MAELSIERPRLMLTTHKLVSHPGIFSVLITRCTSATESARRERIRDRLVRELEVPPVQFNEKFNVTAAGFAVSNAINDLHLLAKSGAWSWHGRIVDQLVPPEHRSSVDALFDLTPLERIHYLLSYLEADGAAIVKYADILLREREVTASALGKRASEIIKSIIEEYLSIGLMPKEQRKWKNHLENLRSKDYDAATELHKVLPHVLPLVHFGFLRAEGDMTSGYRFYVDSHQAMNPLREILNHFSDLRKLENSIMMSEEYFLVIPPLVLSDVRFASPGTETVINEILTSYENLRDTTTGLANLAALARFVYLRLLGKGFLVRPQGIRQKIEDLHRDNPSTIRYHVDGRGELRFVVIDINNARLQQRSPDAKHLT